MLTPIEGAVIAARGAGPLLLLVDYPGRRAGARIGDLPLENHGFELCDTLHRPPLGASPADYAGYSYSRRS